MKYVVLWIVLGLFAGYGFGKFASVERTVTVAAGRSLPGDEP